MSEQETAVKKRHSTSVRKRQEFSRTLDRGLGKPAEVYSGDQMIVSGTLIHVPEGVASRQGIQTGHYVGPEYRVQLSQVEKVQYLGVSSSIYIRSADEANAVGEAEQNG